MIRNLTKKNVVCAAPRFARGIWTRARGMIGRKFEGFDGMVFEHCSSIHTCFMGMALDVLFLDGENRVVRLKENLKPWNPGVFCREGKTVLELPAGMIGHTLTEVGDRLDLAAETAAETVPQVEQILSKPLGTIASFGDKKI